MANNQRLWNFDSCLHEAGHAIVALTSGRKIKGLTVFARTEVDTMREQGGKCFLDGEDPDILEPDNLRRNMVIVAAGLVAELLHLRWLSIHTRQWPTAEEVLHVPSACSDLADCLLYPSPFSSVFTDERYRAVACQSWLKGTDSTLIANDAFLLCHGSLDKFVERVWPLPPIWEETQRNLAFLNEIRNAERRAADILRLNWEALLRLAEALCCSEGGYLNAAVVCGLCGPLTPAPDPSADSS